MVVALGADLEPVGDAGPGRGGPRVLHGGRGVRLPRRPRGVRGRAGRHRCDVDAVQVPAGAERDGAAGARLPRPSVVSGERSEIALVMPLRRADPAVARRLQGDPRGVRGARHRVASRPPRARARPRPARSPASTTAPRCRSTCSSACRKHRVPEVVADSGMCVDGWIPVDPVTLATQFPGVYAVGDVASVGTPKAGVFAEGQAAVVADEIIATVRGGSAARLRRVAACATSSSARRASPSSTSRSWPARHRSASSTARRVELTAAKDGVRHDPGQALVRQRLVT